MRDLRPLLFAGALWYESLVEPEPGAGPAWYLAKSEWGTGDLLSAAAAFARDSDLIDLYRARFRGIEPQDLLPERAAAKRRTISSPIWVIAHELVAARYLERVLGWTYVCHEPSGYWARRADWEFRTPSERRVFVEVKTVEEPERGDTGGAYSRSVNDSQIRDVVKGAYQQLPDDDRATLVVLAGRGDTLSVWHRILFSDIGQTMFGRYQVRFMPMSDTPNDRAGPSLRDRRCTGPSTAASAASQDSASPRPRCRWCACTLSITRTRTQASVFRTAT